MSSKKDFIDDGLKNDDIIKYVSDIIKRSKDIEFKKMNDDDKYEKLKKEFDFFSSRYPMLFELALRDDDNFNWDNLQYMLGMRNKIINNELTAEKASEVVGKEWFNKYVDINNIPKNKK